MTLEEAKEMVKDRIDFVNGIPTPLCIRTSKFSYSDKTVRDYMKTEGTQNITAGAFIVNNPVTQVFFNFFINITGVDKLTPTRCFSSEEDAVLWLKKYRSNEPDKNLSEMIEN